VEESEGELAGVVARVEAPRILHLRSAEGTMIVEVANNADLWRDHPVELGAFAPGDWVVAEGQWDGQAFRARSLASMLGLMEGKIRKKGPRRLDTTGGAMQLTADTLPHEGGGLRGKALRDLAVGDPVIALGRYDPGLDAFVALRIGVKTDAFRADPPPHR
jgi:hypothetical protein